MDRPTVGSPLDSPGARCQRVKELALALGFDLAGVAAARPTPETAFLREWLARGYAGEMHYLERRAEARIDPRRVLEGARSIVVVGLVYDPGTPVDPSGRSPSASEERARGLANRKEVGRRAASRRRAKGQSPGASEERARGLAKVARYAGGDDYHDVLLERLRALASALEALVGEPLRTRAYVDTGPVQERVFAALAGLGWIGKNTCLIHPRLGSYLFLGVLLTDLDLLPDARLSDHCGSCRACLDACPTGAFPEPYVMDATRCISYTTIEARGPVPEALRSAHGDWIFGCDICQEVCPWNRRERRRVPADPHGLRARLAPREVWKQPALAWILGLDEDAWRGATRRTALRRAKHRGLLRNALVAAGNSGDAGLAPLVRRHAQGPDRLLAEHARWALARLEAAPADPR